VELAKDGEPALASALAHHVDWSGPESRKPHEGGACFAGDGRGGAGIEHGNHQLLFPGVHRRREAEHTCAHSVDLAAANPVADSLAMQPDLSGLLARCDAMLQGSCGCEPVELVVVSHPREDAAVV
jgi:hypothetical protein